MINNNGLPCTHTGWHELADRVLDGSRLSVDEGMTVLGAGDEELLGLLDAAYRVRRRYFGNQVRLNFLMNAKSGQCSEDCGYCSQSSISSADIPKYNLLDPEKILDGARVAAQLRPKPTARSSPADGRAGRNSTRSPRSFRR